MTVIIGAELSDGRKVMLCDGNIISSGGGHVASSFVKIRSITSTYKKRTALIGVAGSPGRMLPVINAVSAYLNTPIADIEDISYKLQNEFERTKAADYSAMLWLPIECNGIISHHLVSVTDDHFARPVEGHAWAIGSGGVEARSALLGLAKRDKEHPLSGWRPSIDDLDIAYSVACELDIFCGGKKTFLSL